ncbi:MAG: helicase associated domain-containing protein, partial [Candidatus Riflebacteria bacterium]|nr:helicase associated domain-containing protein [Candidatus Riflebacteria bacterium]
MRAIRELMARSLSEYRDRCGPAATRFRARYAKGTLPTHIVEALEAIPGWVWVSATARYAAILQATEEYAQIHGLHDVDGNTTHRGFEIGRWLVAQRCRHRRGTISTWLKKRLERLPGFSVALVPEERRHAPRTLRVARQHLARLRVLLARPARPGRSRECVHNSLWHLRRYFLELRKRGQLPFEIGRELESLPGWTWHQETLLEKDRRFLDLAKRLAEAGKLDEIKRHSVIDGLHLGAWLSRCRSRLRRGTLPAWLRRGLTKLCGGCLLIGQAALERKKMGLLRRFLRHHSLAELSSNRAHSGVDLRSWVLWLRATHRRGVRRAIDRELESLPGWTWDPREARRRRLVRAAGLPDGVDPYGRPGARRPAARPGDSTQLDAA